LGEVQQFKELAEKRDDSAPGVFLANILACRLAILMGMNRIDTEENGDGDVMIGKALRLGMPLFAQAASECADAAGKMQSSIVLHGTIAFATDLIRGCGHRSLILTGWGRPRDSLKHLRLAKRVHRECIKLIAQH